MRAATTSYLNSIPRQSQDYEYVEHLHTLVRMGATPLAALWVVEKKISRRMRRTIERLENGKERTSNP